MMKEVFSSILQAIVGLAQMSLIDSNACCSNPTAARQCALTEVCANHVWNRPRVAPPLQVTGYMEALCPDTRRWITTQLYPTWQQIGSIMDVQLVPYGKASQTFRDSKWQFTCQHGPQECVGNVIFTCAMKMYRDVRRWFPFINCFERNVGSQSMSTARACAQAHNIDFNAVHQCATNSTGNTWEHQMGVMTDNLNPTLNYVPWVVLNGRHNSTIQQRGEYDLLRFLCDAYTGQKPVACLKLYAAEYHL